MKAIVKAKKVLNIKSHTEADSSHLDGLTSLAGLLGHEIPTRLASALKKMRDEIEKLALTVDAHNIADLRLLMDVLKNQLGRERLMDETQREKLYANLVMVLDHLSVWFIAMSPESDSFCQTFELLCATIEDVQKAIQPEKPSNY